jgi:hypothetical protein
MKTGSSFQRSGILSDVELSQRRVSRRKSLSAVSVPVHDYSYRYEPRCEFHATGGYLEVIKRTKSLQWPSHLQSSSTNCMLQGHSPRRVAVRHQDSAAGVATLRLLSCFHSSRLRCSRCYVVRFWSDPEACSLVTGAVAMRWRHVSPRVSLSPV